MRGGESNQSHTALNGRAETRRFAKNPAPSQRSASSFGAKTQERLPRHQFPHLPVPPGGSRQIPRPPVALPHHPSKEGDPMLCSWAQMEPCREVTAPGEARETWIYRRLAPRATACSKPLWGRAALAGAQAQTSCGKKQVNHRVLAGPRIPACHSAWPHLEPRSPPFLEPGTSAPVRP